MGEKRKFTYEQGGSMRPDSQNQPAQQPDSQNQPAQQPVQQQPAQQPQVQPPQTQQTYTPQPAASQQAEPQRAEQPRSVSEQPAARSSAPAKKSKPKKKKKRGWLVVVAVLLVLVVGITALQLTGVFNFVGLVAGLFGGAPAVHSYTVENETFLVRYLKHPALIPGDTLELGGNFTIDVDEAFGGFAMLPLINISGVGSLTFTGGTVILSGGVSDIDMSRVSFSGTRLYVDAPGVDLKLGSADDTNINVATLNGAAHLRTLDMPFVGTRMTVPVTFTNESGAGLSNVTVNLTSAGFLFADGDSVSIDSLPAGGTVTLDIDVLAVEGGRLEIIGYATDETGRQTVSGTSGYVYVEGAGYYAGDVHTHTSESTSVRYGTLEDNVTYGYAHGMSFITSVESDVEAVRLSQSEVDALVGAPSQFIQLTGGETSQGTLDLLILNTDVRPSADYGEVLYNHGQWIYQDAINEVLSDGGMVILPHFFSYGNFETMIPLIKSSRGATAMEIMTLDMTTAYTELNYYLNSWAAINVQGRQKMFGVFSSNNVYSSEVGTKYIKGYMPILNEENIYAMLQSGNYFMSNGPELRFTMGGVPMGGDLYASEEGGMVNVQMFACDTSPITTVRLLRYQISGNIDDIEYEVVYEEDFTGQGVYSYNNDLDLEIGPNTIYRLEVMTESARNYEDAGMALSNPIYVQAGEANSFCHIEKLSTALGGAVKQAPNGTYYIEAKALKTGAVNATGTGESITVEYHINNGDYVADYATVSMLGADGTRTYYKVYVVN